MFVVQLFSYYESTLFRILLRAVNIIARKVKKITYRITMQIVLLRICDTWFDWYK